MHILLLLPVVRWPRSIDMECTVGIKISSWWLCSYEEMSTSAERRQLELTLLLSLEEREEKEEVQLWRIDDLDSTQRYFGFISGAAGLHHPQQQLRVGPSSH